MSNKMKPHERLADRLRALESMLPDEDRLPQVLAALEPLPSVARADSQVDSAPRSPSMAPRSARRWAAALGLAAAACAGAIWFSSDLFESAAPSRQSHPTLATVDDLQTLIAKSQKAQAQFERLQDAPRLSSVAWRNQQLAALAVQELDFELTRRAQVLSQGKAAALNSSQDAYTHALWQSRVQYLQQANQGQLNARLMWVD